MDEQQNQPKISTKETKMELEAKLEELKIKRLEAEVQQQALSLGLSYINLKGLPIPPETLKIVPEEEAKKLKVIPFLQDEKKICLAVLNPADPLVDELKIKLETETGLNVVFYLTSEISLLAGLKLYRSLPKIKKRDKGLEISEEEILNFQTKIKNFDDLQREIQRNAAPEIITLTIAAAIKSRASDIHLEPEERDIKFRFRIDGVLHDIATLPKRLWPDIISRLKLLSSLKINVTDQPQDGHFPIFFSQQKIDVRVSVLPSSFGESVVIRLLMFGQKISLENLGFRLKYLDSIKKEIDRPNGMIITTGPTGAGKTTTLYAILDRLNNPETKIITLEEPIEYELPGATQISVNTSKGQDFAKMFRAVMRQDPDIVMVGEIRDQETAETAIQAALTGHLVLSTLHTNDAAGAIPRLLALGVKPYLLVPALNLIIAQRLVRKICENCREEIKLAPNVLAKVREILNELPEEEKKQINLPPKADQPWTGRFYRGRGCEICQNIGYKGRIGIFEFFTMNPKIKDLVLKTSAAEHEIHAALKEQKMITMAQDGLLKALKGITTVEEVFRVVG